MRLIIGTRPSPLALAQSQDAVKRLQALLPHVELVLVPRSSPGDEDRTTDLRSSAPDFFTRYLDDALRRGEIDCAIHSAKDLPPTTPPVPVQAPACPSLPHRAGAPLAAARPDIDWVWLPWREDPRDALVLRPGVTAADLPAAPVVGVSSDRRADYCRQRWPNAKQISVRGNIQERLEQLDRGDFDVLFMAVAALNRLGLSARATELLPTDDLVVPAGQGYLALTFRASDARLQVLRGLFVKAARFVGGGPGDPALCTLAGQTALAHADLCVYDALVPQALLAHLPPQARAVFVGKRRQRYAVPHAELQQLLEDGVRQGRRVVHLKGGDPGIFGRLAEELEGLIAMGLPFHVIPGVSSLTAATTPTGFLLTRRGLNRGFSVLTCRAARDEGDAPIDASVRAAQPVVFFMSVHRAAYIADGLIADGWAPSTPAVLLLAASTSDAQAIHATLGDLPAKVAPATAEDLPGLLVVGGIADPAWRFPVAGPYAGRRILLTASADVLPRAHQAVLDYGGQPIDFPLIALTREPAAEAAVARLAEFDWVVLTSPAAVRCFLETLAATGQDLRRVPKLLVNGPETAAALAARGLHVDLQPTSGFTSVAMLAAAHGQIPAGARVLRLVSDAAGPHVSEGLTAMGCQVTDVVLYHNVPIAHPKLPAFDAVLFASPSGVAAFEHAWGIAPLAHKLVVALGPPTRVALAKYGLIPTVVPANATLTDALAALAAHLVDHTLATWKE